MMKIVHRQPDETADISSARGTSGKELRQMILSALVLLVAIYFLTGMIVDFVVAHISFETEAKVFKYVKLPAAKAPETPDQEDLKKVEAILATLQRDTSVPPLPYQLVVIEDTTPNALAFPGGTIGVTTGLLDMLDEDIEIAFVIGHELGHYFHRDHLQGIGRAIGFRILIATILGSATDSFGNMIEFIFHRQYSQDAERAADRFGLERVYAAYGNMEGVDRLFQILREERQLPGWAYMFATHPSPQERINELKRYATELRGKS